MFISMVWDVGCCDERGWRGLWHTGESLSLLKETDGLHEGPALGCQCGGWPKVTRSFRASKALGIKSPRNGMEKTLL